MKRKRPSAVAIRNIESVRVLSNWQSFGGFNDYPSESDYVDKVTP